MEAKNNTEDWSEALIGKTRIQSDLYKIVGRSELESASTRDVKALARALNYMLFHLCRLSEDVVEVESVIKRVEKMIQRHSSKTNG